MKVLELVQTKLDELLLPYGVLSHHIRRVDVDKIAGSTVAINKDEYVVYRLVSTNDGTFGDGNAQLTRQYIDINYYYKYDKNDAKYKEVTKRIKAIKNAFLTDTQFRLANGESDLPDIDSPYRGVNLEFLYIGVCDYDKDE